LSVSVFYSWQSDLPNATNRGFIGSALEKAVKRIRRDDTLKVVPVVERDTLNLSGSPDIAQAIFRKIEQSSAFVADVSLINSQEGRPTPNPNVLLELGYAFRHLGSECVLMLFNTAYGRIEQLPFDLRLKRVVTYHIPVSLQEKAAERNRLSQEIERGLRLILSASPLTPAVEIVFDHGSAELTVSKTCCAGAPDDGKKAELASRVVCLNLLIRNHSSKPVVDVRCILEVPEAVILLSSDKLRKYWRAYPEQPFNLLLQEMVRPKTVNDVFREASYMLSFALFESDLGKRRERPKYAAKKDLKGDFSITDVHFLARKLQQQTVQPLEPSYLLFPSWAEVKSLNVGYRIDSDNVVTEDALVVSINRKDRSDPPFEVA
jgi:hypothetical protein